ncbi:MAG: hypothetical protein V1774_02825 [Candidatus Eisenbacteria bacterium]
MKLARTTARLRVARTPGCRRVSCGLAADRGARGGGPWPVLAAATFLLASLGGCRPDPPPAGRALVNAACDADSVGVGDALEVRFTALWPAVLGSAHLAWAPSSDSLLVIARDSTTVSAARGWSGRGYAVRAIVPRPGVCRVGPAALIGAGGDTLALSPVLLVTAGGRLGNDATADLAPLAPLAALRRFPWIWVVAAAAVAGAAVAAWRWRRRRTRPMQEEIPLPPPADEFEESLRRLRSLGLPERGEMRAYAQELSWVLRRYLGRRWLRPALEATRPEIVRWLPETDLCVRDQGELAGWLERTDRVKFAGEKPLLSEAEELAQRAAAMVRRTEEIFVRREREASGAAGEGPADSRGGAP